MRIAPSSLLRWRSSASPPDSASSGSKRFHPRTAVGGHVHRRCPRVIEADFGAVELVSALREEVKRLPSRYVSAQGSTAAEATPVATLVGSADLTD